MKHKLWLPIFGSLAVVLAGCGQSSSNPSVIATLFPQYSLASRLAGDLIEVDFLLPIGVDPHDFEPTPRQRTNLNRADLVLFTSESFESWVHAVEETANGKFVDLSSVVTLIEGEPHDHEEAQPGLSLKQMLDDHEDEHDYDPHYWIDPANALLMLNTIAAELKVLLPDDVLLIESRRLLIEEALEETIALYQSLVLDGAELDIVFAGHNAFGYLTQYEVHVLTPYPGFSTEVVPTAQSLIAFTELIQSLNTNILYISSTDNAAITEVLLESNPGLETQVLYTMENVSQAQFNAGITYQELLMLNYEALAIHEA
jgi:zinc transport system substrate-binding protein